MTDTLTDTRTGTDAGPGPGADTRTGFDAGRAWHGVGRRYRRVGDGAAAAALRSLARAPLVLDAAGVDFAWGLGGDATRTVLRSVRRDAPGRAPRCEQGPWAAAFEAAVARIAVDAARPALALGGGLDAAAVLAAWQRTGHAPPVVLTLETGLEDYDEVAGAERIAAACGAHCERVDASPARWLAALPSAIAAAGTPLYNLHPVGRWLLAVEARRRGCTTLITGDGADAAFAGTPDVDYVPIVTALGDAASVVTRSPFFDDALLATTLAQGHDRQKRALAAWLVDHAPSVARAVGKKHPRMLPALALEALLEARLPALSRLARDLGRPLRLDGDRARVGWLTLELLLESLRSDGLPGSTRGSR